ncbi:hypothetical protein QYE76_058459 [Lolium multiflorum]|uniref:Cysteine-rich receptor-like protein kinase 10 n=1 Tax=Lolium multiflorum TaxID=4521 RepID=A0AAD8WSG8_LOLMU|nr:hypothetical protein QYE76_058459 [Lolium multiflorum]
MAVLFLAIVALLLAPPQAAGYPWPVCGSTGSFTANDTTYLASINTIAATLTRNASTSPGLYATAQAGQVRVLALCRGDANATSCSGCLEQGFQDLPSACAYSKEATMYYDTCFLHYSNLPLNASDDTALSSAFHFVYSATATAEPARFDRVVAALLNATADYAAYNSSVARLYASGVVSFDREIPQVYSWAQCTPDLTPARCRGCLANMIRALGTPLYSVGARSLGIRCSFRYENRPFLDGPLMGTLPDGEEIAVKRLSKSSTQGVEELKNELALVAKLKHKNLVRLVGVCMEQQERLLVYEFIPNRSLDQILFDIEKREQLDWGKRQRIIRGIARGLQYLHEDSQLKVVHRDLKASNVLLDADMNPKISDFGLAKLFGRGQTQGVTNHVMGTYGYMAPEYVMHGNYSVKSDVFSFGVMVLEIVTGRKNNDTTQFEDLLTTIWEHWMAGTVLESIDPSMNNSFSKMDLMRCIQVGLLCVQENPVDRPVMSAVCMMLGSHTVSLGAPSKPYSGNGFELTIQDSNLKEADDGKKMKKQSDDSAATVAQIAAAENKVSEGGVGSSAATTSALAETISNDLTIPSVSEAIGTLASKDQEKKEPPLTKGEKWRHASLPL